MNLLHHIGYRTVRYQTKRAFLTGAATRRRRQFSGLDSFYTSAKSTKTQDCTGRAYKVVANALTM
jgi:hypothetical protein